MINKCENLLNNAHSLDQIKSVTEKLKYLYREWYGEDVMYKYQEEVPGYFNGNCYGDRI